MSGKTRKKTAKPKTSSESGIHSAIVDSVEKLLKLHGGEIRTMREESEQNIANIAFSVKIDGSEAETTVKTQIRFSSSVTDSVTARLDDPNQNSFDFIKSAADDIDKPKAKAKKGKKEAAPTEVEVPVSGEGESA